VNTARTRAPTRSPWSLRRATGALEGKSRRGSSRRSAGPRSTASWRSSSRLPSGYARITRTAGTNPYLAYAVVNDGASPGQRSGDGAFLRPSRSALPTTSRLAGVRRRVRAYASDRPCPHRHSSDGLSFERPTDPNSPSWSIASASPTPWCFQAGGSSLLRGGVQIHDAQSTPSTRSP